MVDNLVGSFDFVKFNFRNFSFIFIGTQCSLASTFLIKADCAAKVYQLIDLSAAKLDYSRLQLSSAKSISKARNFTLDSPLPPKARNFTLDSPLQTIVKSRLLHVKCASYGNKPDLRLEVGVNRLLQSNYILF